MKDEKAVSVLGGQFLCWCSEWKGNNEGGGGKDKRRIERKKRVKKKWKKGQRERERRERDTPKRVSNHSLNLRTQDFYDLPCPRRPKLRSIIKMFSEKTQVHEMVVQQH